MYLSAKERKERVIASFGISGISELNDMFSKLSDIPADVKKDILLAMAEQAEKGQQTVGKQMSVYDPQWEGTHVLDSFKVNKPVISNTDGYVTVTFTGKRKRGNNETRNAEIAFINEFGASRKGISARPFISTANEQYADQIFKAGEDVFDDWLDKIN